MNTDRRDSIRTSLRCLSEAHATTLKVMELTYALLCEELALNPQECFSRPATAEPPPDHLRPVIGQSRFTVSFRGRTCCLGITMSFRFLARLAERPGRYDSQHHRRRPSRRPARAGGLGRVPHRVHAVDEEIGIGVARRLNFDEHTASLSDWLNCCRSLGGQKTVAQRRASRN
jgi:hypothetical protein